MTWKILTYSASRLRSSYSGTNREHVWISPGCARSLEGQKVAFASRWLRVLLPGAGTRPATPGEVRLAGVDDLGGRGPAHHRVPRAATSSLRPRPAAGEVHAVRRAGHRRYPFSTTRGMLTAPGAFIPGYRLLTALLRPELRTTRLLGLGRCSLGVGLFIQAEQPAMTSLDPVPFFPRLRNPLRNDTAFAEGNTLTSRV